MTLQWQEVRRHPVSVCVNQQFLHVFIYRLNFSLSEDEDENTLVLDLAVYRWDRRINTNICTCPYAKVLTAPNPPDTWTPPSLTWTFSRHTPESASKGRCVLTSCSHWLPSLSASPAAVSLRIVASKITQLHLRCLPAPSACLWVRVLWPGSA